MLNQEKRLASGSILIGLVGKKQTGKDTSFKFIKEAVSIAPHYLLTKRLALADKLKDVTADLFGVDRAKLDGTDEEKDSPTHIRWKEVSNILYLDFFGRKEGLARAIATMDTFMTHRELLQIFGTNACRGIMPAIWTEYLRRAIEASTAYINVVTDARFPNEIEMLKNMGGYLVKLYRNTGSLLATNHPSETALDSIDDSYYDFVIQDEGNRTMQELEQSWKTILKQILV